MLNVQQSRTPRVSDRADSILRYLESKSSILGTSIVIPLPNEDDEHNHTPETLEQLFAVYFELLCRSETVKRDDLEFLLNYLKKQGFISTNLTYDSGYSELGCGITFEGYIRLESIRETNTDSLKAFVAMWFDSSMDEVWNKGIRPAITEAGYEPVRADEKEHLNRIDDEIIAEIRRARFVVADFTHGQGGARGGVYYEAGFAHALGIDVIFACRQDMMKELHFDTRQFNHISWNNSEELKDALKNRISAIFGDGPLKNQ